jgi:hypothetical protein
MHFIFGMLGTKFRTFDLFIAYLKKLRIISLSFSFRIQIIYILLLINIFKQEQCNILNFDLDKNTKDIAFEGRI